MKQILQPKTNLLIKSTLLLTLLIFTAGAAKAQMLNPVKWQYFAKKTAANEYEIHLKALMNNGWHVYAQDAGKGPIPTSFKFNKQPGVQLEGKVKATKKPKRMYDRNFQSILKFYEKEVDFVQKVKVKPGTKEVSGTLEFMVCNDVNCLPPKNIDFSVKL